VERFNKFFLYWPSFRQCAPPDGDGRRRRRRINRWLTFQATHTHPEQVLMCRPRNQIFRPTDPPPLLASSAQVLIFVRLSGHFFFQIGRQQKEEIGTQKVDGGRTCNVREVGSIGSNSVADLSGGGHSWMRVWGCYVTSPPLIPLSRCRVPPYELSRYLT
jgi:hypothetical protein